MKYSELLTGFTTRDNHAVESFKAAFPYNAPIEARLLFTEERLADLSKVTLAMLMKLAEQELT